MLKKYIFYYVDTNLVCNYDHGSMSKNDVILLTYLSWLFITSVNNDMDVVEDLKCAFWVTVNEVYVISSVENIVND